MTNYTLELFYLFPVKLNFLNIILIFLNILQTNAFIILFIILIYFNIVANYLKALLFLFIFKNTDSSFYFILFNFYTGYYKLHPLILYFITLNFFFWLIEVKSNLKYSLKEIFFYLVLTFTLGSLWALTQFSWGKYWSYDIIEIVLLILIFFCLFLLHQNKFFFSIKLIWLYNQFWVLLIALRLNFLFTKHNFFLLTFSFRYYYFVFYIVCQGFLSFCNIKNKFISNVSLFSTVIYCFIIQIHLNFSNNLFFKSMVVVLWYIFVFFLIIFFLKNLKSKLVHWFFFINISLFNIYDLNYFRYFDIFWLSFNDEWTNFFFKRKNNFFIFHSDIAVYFHEIDYVGIKFLNIFQTFDLAITKLTNII